jgi:signal peptide peptidase SppA
MTLLPHMAARIFGAPLLIHRPKLEVILAVLGPRIGLTDNGTPLRSPATRSPPAPDAGIAVLPIYGTLVRRTVGLDAASGLTSYQDIARQLDSAIADPSVAAIVLDIDSPGGESGGVFDLADRVRAAAQIKPVWALANDMAYSAAYAIGSAASRFFVTRTGGVGSIGVIAMHADQSVKDAKDGVRYTTVFAGARKNDLNPHEPISDEAHAFLKREVDRIYGLFVDTVANHRGLTSDAVRATEAGVFFGQDAVAAGLADAVGTFDDLLAELTAALSPPPALATAAPGHLHPPRLEPFMNEPGTTADPGVGADPDRTDGAHPPMTIEDAQEIAELCALAGCPERIAGFLATRTSPSAVRGHLLAARATGQEINSLITPSAATTATQSLNDNPLVLAARARAGQEK